MSTTPMDFVKIVNSMFRRDAITVVAIDDSEAGRGTGHYTLVVCAGPIHQTVSKHSTLAEAEHARNELFLRITLVTPEEDSDGAMWELWLTDSGATKIQVIKEVRGLTNLGLKEAKDIVDEAYSIMNRRSLVHVFDDHTEALRGKRVLETAGATATVQRA